MDMDFTDNSDTINWLITTAELMSPFLRQKTVSDPPQPGCSDGMWLNKGRSLYASESSESNPLLRTQNTAETGVLLSILIPLVSNHNPLVLLLSLLLICLLFLHTDERERAPRYLKNSATHTVILTSIWLTCLQEVHFLQVGRHVL